jgi:hypothetical protein
MLDRASLHALARHPDKNDPVLNLALAEEGDIEVLLALADCRTVGPDTLSRIGARIQAEGERVGQPEASDSDDDSHRGSRRDEGEPGVSNGSELDKRLIFHPRADDEVREAVARRHDGDPFFMLAAAAHRHATERSVERVVAWPSATPLHDRTWLTLIDPRAVSTLTLAAWAVDENELYREAAATLADDPAVLEGLARDRSRRVRRAVAGNPKASALLEMLRADPACDVRARANAAAARPSEPAESRGTEVSGARFKAAVDGLLAGGRLAADVIRALRTESLDDDAARWAARSLDDAAVTELVTSLPLTQDRHIAFAAGIALRDLAQGETRGAGLLAQSVRALADADRSGSHVTGKGRLASWLAEGVLRLAADASQELVAALSADTLAADRMVLGRVFGPGSQSELLLNLCNAAAAGTASLPIALLEAVWRCRDVPDPLVERLAARIAPTDADGAVEHEVDLDPRARPLALLERVGGLLVGKAPLSPRAALTLVALQPRRVRYVLSALPQWKGVLAGAHVARVLKAHAGALTAAGPSPARKPAQVAASWTQRKLDEVELGVALAVCDISPTEALKRMSTGYASLNQGPALASAMEARAALEGPGILEPLVEYVARERSRDAAALAVWLLIEGLDRARSPTAIAAALDAPWVAPSMAPGGSRSMVPPGLSEALATLERRTPGRLAAALPQTPRGRAALASGIARAYRALGGMAVTEP